MPQSRRDSGGVNDRRAAIQALAKMLAPAPVRRLHCGEHHKTKKKREVDDRCDEQSARGQIRSAKRQRDAVVPRSATQNGRPNDVDPASLSRDEWDHRERNQRQRWQDDLPDQDASRLTSGFVSAK